MGIAKTHSEGLMKKLFPAILVAALSFLFVACTTTHVQWDAVQMREGVVDYYNDEIMDNLIRAVSGQPFVYVDVGGLTANATSKLAGTVNGGQTLTNTGTNQKSITTGGMNAGMTIMGTISRMAMRPFSFSVTPERSENLVIAGAPVIGANGATTPDVYDLYL